MALNNILAARQQVQTAAGLPLAGGKVFLYEPGTTIFITSFRDSGLVIPHSNPIKLSGSGRANIWISRDCDLRITDKINGPLLEGNLILEELNANPDALGVSAQGGLIPNGSFEIDADVDDIPDGWTLVNEAGSDNAIDTAESTDGLQSFRFTSTSVGGGSLTTTDFFPVNDSQDLAVNFDLRSTVAAVRNIVRIEWYDVSQVFISNSDVYDSTANPTSFTSQNLLATPPALSRFAKLRLIGIDPSVALAGSTFFDRCAVFYPAVVSGVFDNLTIQNNEIISTNTNGHIQLKPNGTGSVEIVQGTPQPIDLVDEEVALILGTAGGQHLEFDDGALQSKSNATTAAALSLNALGGAIELGAPAAAGLTIEADGNVELRSATSTDAEVRRLLLAHADGTLRGLVGYGADDILRLANEIHGGNVELSGENAAGTLRVIFLGDPDGPTELYHAGTKTLSTSQFGRVNIHSELNSDTDIRELQFLHLNGTRRAVLGHLLNDILLLKNEIHGGEINIVQEDAGGAAVIVFSADASNGQTEIIGASVVRLGFSNGEQAFRAQLNSFATIHDNNIEVARTRTTALGGLGVTNLLTGSGLERVLTESDAPRIQVFVKSANETRTNDVTLSDDDHFINMPLEAGKRYSFEGTWQLSGSPGEFDYRFQFTNATQAGTKAHMSVDDTGTQRDSGNSAVAIEDRILLDTGNQMAHIYGHLHANAAVGGTMKLQWAQGVSSGTATTFVGGSWFRLTQLD